MTGGDLIVWLLATLAAYRAWRLWALDDLPPVERARDVVWEATARRFGADWADGWTCVWCSGFWACVAVFAAVDVAGWSVPAPPVQVAAASTVVGLIGSNVDG